MEYPDGIIDGMALFVSVMTDHAIVFGSLRYCIYSARKLGNVPRIDFGHGGQFSPRLMNCK